MGPAAVSKNNVGEMTIRFTNFRAENTQAGKLGLKCTTSLRAALCNNPTSVCPLELVVHFNEPLTSALI